MTTRMPYLGSLGYSHRSLVEVVGGQLSAADHKVQRRPHLIQLHPRRATARLLQQHPTGDSTVKPAPHRQLKESQCSEILNTVPVHVRQTTPSPLFLVPSSSMPHILSLHFISFYCNLHKSA